MCQAVTAVFKPEVQLHLRTPLRALSADVNINVKVSRPIIDTPMCVSDLRVGRAAPGTHL